MSDGPVPATLSVLSLGMLMLRECYSGLQVVYNSESNNSENETQDHRTPACRTCVEVPRKTELKP